MPHPSLANPRTFKAGFDHVSKSDPVLRPILEKRGILRFALQGELFESVVESILSQQLAGAAADSIISKVRGIYPEGKLSAKSINRTRLPTLRKAGVSPQKVTYLKDLSSRVLDGRLDLESLRDEPDEKVIEALDEVKGIGRWTAQMVLIFTLGRPDVLPVDDYGIKTSAQEVYGLKSLPDGKTLEALGRSWHPFSTVASLYLWRHKEGAGP